MPATINDRVAELTADAQAITDLALSENREPTDDEQAQFEAVLTALGNLGKLNKGVTDAQAILDQPSRTGDSGPTNFGRAFTESDEYARIRDMFPNGIPERTQIQTNAVKLGDVMNLLVDPSLTPNREVLDIPTNVAVFDLMSAITVIPGAPKSIDHHTATFTNNAAVVDEAQDGVTPINAATGLKPESEIAFVETPLTQKAVAHWLEVTNQAFEFNRMLEALINAFMVNGVRARAQAKVAAEVAAWSGLTAQAFDTDLRTTLRKAVTKSQINGQLVGNGNPSILISATDAETLDLEQLDKLVLSPGEAPQQASNVWRHPLVVSASLPSGFAYVGDLRQIIWYTTGDVQMRIGHQGTQIIENKQTMVFETFGVTGILGAAGIVKADLTA